MKYFLAFQKKKAIPVPLSQPQGDNQVLVDQLNIELMQYGFILDTLVQEKLAKCSANQLDIIYHDLLVGIGELVPGGGYEAIFKGFPASVKEWNKADLLKGIVDNGFKVSVEEGEYLAKEFAIEHVEYKPITYMTNAEFENIFYNIIYSNNSINAFDKQIIEWFLLGGFQIDLNKVVFKETLAYLGQKLLNSDLPYLPIKNATDVLRIYSAYSGGDEGLKTNTKFVNPTNKQRKMLSNTLEICYNLEEAFKIDREKWLRLLFYLHPMGQKNVKVRPNLAKYAYALRNEPKTLKTFNSKVEEAISNKDVKIFDLLKSRMGVFSRRLDHLIRVFDRKAIEEWLDNKPNTKQMVDVYNHLFGRDKVQGGRSAILAGQGSSEMVTYKDLAPLPTNVVNDSREAIKQALEVSMKGSLGKVFIDPLLYLRPLAMNNRAASLSITGKAIGTVEAVPAGKVLRMYCMWEGRDDIDLSGLILNNSNQVTKIGWNGRYTSENDAVTYSGDNTGRYDKNAEFLDIDIVRLAPDTEWIIMEATIYRGPSTYKAFSVPPLAGFMLREKPDKNDSWLPKTAAHSVALTSDTNNAYLAAFHYPTRSMVYLDMAMGQSNVSGPEDALMMRVFLNKFIPNTTGGDEICWDTINQGHIINLLATEIVSDPINADIVFDNNTPQEEIAKYL